MTHSPSLTTLWKYGSDMLPFMHALYSSLKLWQLVCMHPPGQGPVPHIQLCDPYTPDLTVAILLCCQVSCCLKLSLSPGGSPSVHNKQSCKCKQAKFRHWSIGYTKSQINFELSVASPSLISLLPGLSIMCQQLILLIQVAWRPPANFLSPYLP